MDTYCYISENGTVRQIEDLIAKAKNEEQDALIAAQAGQITQVRTDLTDALNGRIKIIPYNDTAAASASELLVEKAKLFVAGGFTVGSTAIGVMKGGWLGQQYGFSIAMYVRPLNYLDVVFLGTETIIKGIVDVETYNVITGTKTQGEPL